MEINDVGFDGRAQREDAARTDRAAKKSHAGSKADPGGKQSAPGSQQDITARMLDQLSDQAMELPPRNIHVLAASVQKFLLTNLEPAMRIAREIRDQASVNSAQAMEDMVSDGRREQALAVLTANDS